MGAMALSIPLLLSLLPLLLLLLLLLLHHHHQNSKAKTKPPPPGPRPLPIIGNLHQLGPIVHRSLHALSKLHGPLIQLSLGRVPTLIVSSPSLARRILTDHDLSSCSRPQLTTFQHYSFNGRDIASASYGPHWRHLRKLFTIELLSSTKLKTFTHIREEETVKMMEAIRKTQEVERKIVNMTEMMIRLTSNVICRVALGCRSEGGYGKRSRFQGVLEEAHALMASFFMGDFFPGFGWVDTATGKMRRLRRNCGELDEFYQDVIDEHLNKGEGEEEKDIIDVMLRLWRDGDQQITMDHIKASVMNIIIAGTDTSAATVIWAMSELARHPAVMIKVQDSVRKAIGNKGVVEEIDLPQLQYLKFVVNETLRLHPPLPLLIPRETIQHFKIDGYDIAPKTRVFINVWAIGRDEEAWENPEEFNPDRFDGSPVDFRGHDFEFLPFGAGRRICPGINLGITSVELALANVLYAFDWELPPGMKKEDIDMCEAPGVVTHKKIDLCLVAINKDCSMFM